MVFAFSNVSTESAIVEGGRSAQAFWNLKPSISYLAFFLKPKTIDCAKKICGCVDKFRQKRLFEEEGLAEAIELAIFFSHSSILVLRLSLT